MNTKTLGVVYGAGILVLWFMPFNTVNFMGFEGTQNGQNIGGIAYLLLLAGGVIAVTSWFEQYQPCMIAAGAGLVISLLLALGLGSNIAWGLVGLIFCFIVAGIRAYKAFKLVKPVVTSRE